MDRRCRATLVTGTVTLLFGASAAFGAGSAAAAVANGCGDTVQGTPGEAVALGPVVIGAVPSSGSTTLAVGPACNVVVEAVGAVEQAAPATAPVTDAVRGAAPGVLPQRPVPGQPAPVAPAPGQQPGAALAPAAAPAAAPVMQYGPFLAAGFNPGVLQRGVYNFGGLMSLYDYSQLFAASPGAFGRLPAADLFGSSPEFGILGAKEGMTAAEDVAAAGRAQALPTSGGDRIALPVLVAVLMLSGVTAGLIRSWVTRPVRR